MQIDKIYTKIQRVRKDLDMNNQLAHHNYIAAAERAKKWIQRNTIRQSGIVITSKQRQIYQEVTGYYIPTLLQWGMRELSVRYAEYLCEMQQPSGAWLSFDYKYESVFNTGQVLRGLVAICDIMPEAKEYLERGCDWLLSNMEEDGRLASTEGTQWPQNGMNSELIHVYCLPPLVEAGEKLGKKYYVECATKILNYYKKQYRDDIANFNYLSHFYAYVLEALVDLGEKELVVSAMKKIERLQRIDGAVPAYRKCKWVCSTGLFQLAIVWFKLGQWEQGNKAFDYAVSLQNKSGGWYGGYPATVRVGTQKLIPYDQMKEIDYFPNEEISWAVKYFFDALYYREKLEFEKKAHTFLRNFAVSNDGKYQVIFDYIQKMNQRADKLEILDVGCGKGRYLKKLFLQMPQNEYYGIDLSERVLSFVRNKNIHLKVSSILKIEYEDKRFDVVYATESLEHAILLQEAISEMARVLKKNGVLIIIDKDAKSFEQVKYADWIDSKELRTKQWIDVEGCEKMMRRAGISQFESFFLPTSEGNMYRAFVGVKE